MVCSKKTKISLAHPVAFNWNVTRKRSKQICERQVLVDFNCWIYMITSDKEQRWLVYSMLSGNRSHMLMRRSSNNSATQLCLSHDCKGAFTQGARRSLRVLSWQTLAPSPCRLRRFIGVSMTSRLSPAVNGPPRHIRSEKTFRSAKSQSICQKRGWASTG